MGYIGKNLVPGETLAYRSGCHWVVVFWPLVGGAVLGFVAFAFFAGGWMAIRNGGRYEGAMVWGALALLGAVALIAGGIIRRVATEVAVSNRRVIIKTGLLSRRSVEVLLPKVESIGVDQSFLGRILGYPDGNLGLWLRVICSIPELRLVSVVQAQVLKYFLN